MVKCLELSRSATLEKSGNSDVCRGRRWTEDFARLSPLVLDQRLKTATPLLLEGVTEVTTRFAEYIRSLQGTVIAWPGWGTRPSGKRQATSTLFSNVSCGTSKPAGRRLARCELSITLAPIELRHAYKVRRTCRLTLCRLSQSLDFARLQTASPPNNKTNNIQRHPGISITAYSLRILSDKAFSGSCWT